LRRTPACYCHWSCESNQLAEYPRFPPDPEDSRRRLVNIERAPVPECPQLKTLRIGGSLFFGRGLCRKKVTDAKRANTGSTPFLAGWHGHELRRHGAKLLAREGDRRRDWRQLVVSGSEHAFTRLLNIRAVKHLDRVYTSKHGAIAFPFERLDRDTCAIARTASSQNAQRRR
jgi:hypothetical protein